MTPRWRSWKTGLAFLALLAGLATGAWVGRAPLFTWYALRGLGSANEADQELWVGRVVALDEVAVPGLLDLLNRDDKAACVNAGVALTRMLQTWGADQSRALAMVDYLTQRFATLTVPAREAVLEMQVELLRGKAPALGSPANQTAARLLTTAAAHSENGVRLRTLALAEMLVDRAAPETLALVTRLTLEGLQSSEADQRVRGVHLTLHAGLAHEKTLPAKVLPLLKDSAPEVRRAALLALGMAEQLVTEDNLLPFFHDADAEVRRLCESALRGRGLQDRHLRLARLISDARAEEREKVVLHLRDADDLDVGLFLRRLSQDTQPNVRAAAARAAGEIASVEGRDLLTQISRNRQEKESVRQIADYYLRAKK